MSANKDLHDFLNSIPSPVTVADSEITKAPGAKIDNRPRFTCFECAGTGIYRGHRVHQPKSQCFACKGKGYFLSSAQDRAKAKQKAAQRKIDTLEAAKAAFNAAHPGLIDGLRAISSWHQFAQSLLQGYEQYGALTDNQTAAAQKSLIKVQEGQAKRAAEKAQKTGDVDVSTIIAAFNSAVENGKKRPKFITERIVISLASPHGKNPGALYVNCDGDYAGKIVNGVFSPLNSAPADILDLVREIAASPFEAAKLYGKKTGTCSCCGRELTDPASIEAGIGPICAAKWGF